MRMAMTDSNSGNQGEGCWPKDRTSVLPVRVDKDHDYAWDWPFQSRICKCASHKK